MYGAIKERLTHELDGIQEAGLFKNERVIMTPQDSHVRVGSGPEVLNLCANNYLGLAEHPAVLAAARAALDEWGFGMASVRFICGTQGIHKQLEAKLSEFLGTEDTILYGSCFDANGGLFETLLGPEDAVISDALNHASIIDGIRLCKAQRLRYAHNDMADLEARLQEAAGARTRLIATDGVFSMDGTIADLQSICDLAERYDALVMIDDCHATGFLGKTGRGTHEYRNVMGRVDILTGTLGKALGWGQRRLHQRAQGSGFPAAPALPPVSLFQHARAADCRRVADRLGNAVGVYRAARQAGSQYALLPRGHDGAWLYAAAGRASDCADHARRRRAGRASLRGNAGKRCLCRRLFVPGRAAG